MLTPMETFEAASAEIAAGRVQEGARLAYEAAFRAVADAAKRHERPCKTVEDARDFVRWMEGFPDEPFNWVKDSPLFDWLRDENAPQLPIPEFIGAFDIAESFKHHGESPLELTHWEPDEYAFFLPSIRLLVEELATAQRRDPSVWMR